MTIVDRYHSLLQFLYRAPIGSTRFRRAF